jgi:hypothetical protein
MEFNDLLRMGGVDPAVCAIMLHAPVEPELRRGLLAMAQEDPDLFRVYQDNHPRNPDATLKRHGMVASFVVEEGESARFVGMFGISGWTFRSSVELDADPVRQRLQERFRGKGFVELEGEGSGRAVFDLEELPELAELRGRLVIRRSPGRAYMRLATNNRLDVMEISRTPQFAPPAPDWFDFIVSGAEVRVLPKDWQARLREWRGIYLIVDQKDGARYVGSACNEANLLGRWSAHVGGEAGVTVELAGRDPAGFRFSILELLAPVAERAEVIRTENRWKQTLGTREWGLNRN